ncbi:hypothetical protein EVG20_g6957 [Dentipellis fragilis]|uniref:Uncharacterized protein n=1 Tax=Dentipellis fragilis TaxID=205917 RepID=A0A4Y9YH76_9AGAM|nr:hypothetical protein EVG20_g6957 [Dentipellis fragilis]
MDSLFPYFIAGAATMAGSICYFWGQHQAAARFTEMLNQRQVPTATTRRRRTRKRRRRSSIASGGPPGGPDVSDVTEPDSRKRKTPPTTLGTYPGHLLDGRTSPQAAGRERKRTRVSDDSDLEREAPPSSNRMNENTGNRIPIGMGHLAIPSSPASPQPSEIQSSILDTGYWPSRIDAGDLAAARGVTPSPQLVSRATSADFVQGSSSRPLPPRTSLQASAVAPQRHHRRCQNARAAAEREYQRQRVRRPRTPTPAPVSVRAQSPEHSNGLSSGQSTSLPTLRELFPWLRPLAPGEAQAARATLIHPRAPSVLALTPLSPAPQEYNHTAAFSPLAPQTFPHAHDVQLQPQEQPATATYSSDYNTSQLPPDSLLYSSWEPPASLEDYEPEATPSTINLSCPPTPSYTQPLSDTISHLRAQVPEISPREPSPMPAATGFFPMPPLVVPRARYPAGFGRLSSVTPSSASLRRTPGVTPSEHSSIHSARTRAVHTPRTHYMPYPPARGLSRASQVFRYGL